MISRANSYLVLIFFLLPATSTWALIDFEDAVFPELATSARALAMGNAYICKTDDSASAFYNPAGFGTTRYGHFHLSNLHVEFNNGWKDMATGGSLSDAASGFGKGFSVDGVRQLLNEDRGKISHTRFHLTPNFTMRYFSLGYLYSKQLRATIGSGPDPLFEYADRLDHGPYASITLSFLGGVFKIGGTATYLIRKEAIGETDPNGTVELTNEDYKQGKATIFTGGARLTLPWVALPTFAVKMNNASSQVFSPSGSYGGAPDKMKQSIDVGFSLTPQIGKVTRFHMEVNYKDATMAYSGTSSTRRLALGAELDIKRSIFLRFGYGDGFGSAGLGVRSRKIEFDLTTYAIDTSSNSFRGKEDRHFVFSLSSGF